MNNARRDWLDLGIAKLEEQRKELAEIQSEEQLSYDMLPENLCPSKRFQDNIDDLDSCISDLGDIIENLQEIVDR